MGSLGVNGGQIDDRIVTETYDDSPVDEKKKKKKVGC